MKEQTGDTYQGSQYAKALMLDTAKNGKSCFLVGSILGVLPWQKYGGVVDRPSHLHVLSIDSDAMGGVNLFLTKTCNAPPEALKYRIYNLQDDAQRIAMNKEGNDLSFYNTLMSVMMTIQERVQKERGVHAVLFSSLTNIGATVLRGISGDPAEAGAGMSIDKNNRFGQMIKEIQLWGQIDDWHCFWEAHLHKKSPIPKPGQAPQPEKDSLLLRGQVGEQFPVNVEQIFRVRRDHGQKWEGTECDKAYMDTRASSDFVPGGRLFTEKLSSKEPDLTVALHKLGKEIGRWGMKGGTVKTSSATKVVPKTP